MIPRVNSERELARRLVFLTSGVGLGAATFFAGPGGVPNTSLPAFSVAHERENAGARPVSPISSSRRSSQSASG
jgi:hypothetical protein